MGYNGGLTSLHNLTLPSISFNAIKDTVFEYGASAAGVVMQMNPAVQQITSGIALAAVGAWGLVKSGVPAAIKNRFSHQKKSDSQQPAPAPRLGLAAVSTVAIAGGLGLAAHGGYQLYNQYYGTPDYAKPNYPLQENEENLCTKKPGLCKGKIPRDKMPVLEGEPKNKFLGTHEHYEADVHSKDLLIVQGEIVASKVASMQSGLIAGTFNPCEGGIIAAVEPGKPNGPYPIIDGNNRGVACPENQIVRKVTLVKGHICALLNEANSIPGMTHKDMNDKVTTTIVEHTC